MKENNFLAITYIMLGMTAFALQDTVIRLLAVDISILQVMFARSVCLLYTSPSPRDLSTSRMPSSA